MKTPAIIASLTVVGSIAYAAGSQGVSGKQSPVMPRGSQAHSMQEEMPQMRMTDGCTQGADKNWFTTVHDFGPRGYSPCTPLGQYLATDWDSAQPSDVNGDGKLEYLLGLSGGFIENGIVTGLQFCLQEITRTPAGISTTLCRVASTDALADAVRNWDPNVQYVSVRCWLRDMDGDGDLDLIVERRYSSTDWWCWMENTGFQHDNRVAADLNDDGIVDGNDLGNLLAAWGPTQ
jgi:hypothetical protein